MSNDTERNPVPSEAAPAMPVPEQAQQEMVAGSGSAVTGGLQHLPPNLPAWFVEFVREHKTHVRTVNNVDLYDHPEHEVEKAQIAVMSVQELMDKAPELIARYHLARARCDYSVGRCELDTLDEADAMLGYLHWCLGKKIVESVYQQWSDEHWEMVREKQDDNWCESEVDKEEA